MRNRNRYQIEYFDPELYRMETQLGATLHGIAPRPDFVSQLRTRLATEPVQAENNRRIFRYVLLSLAGVISAVLLVIGAVRGVIALFSYLGIIDAADRQPAALAEA